MRCTSHGRNVSYLTAIRRAIDQERPIFVSITTLYTALILSVGTTTPLMDSHIHFLSWIFSSILQELCELLCPARSLMIRETVEALFHVT